MLRRKKKSTNIVHMWTRRGEVFQLRTPTVSIDVKWNHQLPETEVPMSNSQLQNFRPPFQAQDSVFTIIPSSTIIHPLWVLQYLLIFTITFPIFNSIFPMSSIYKNIPYSISSSPNTSPQTIMPKNAKTFTPHQRHDPSHQAALKGPFSTSAQRSARLLVPPKPKDETPAHIARCAEQVSSCGESGSMVNIWLRYGSYMLIYG